VDLTSLSSEEEALTEEEYQELSSKPLSELEKIYFPNEFIQVALVDCIQTQNVRSVKQSSLLELAQKILGSEGLTIKSLEGPILQTLKHYVDPEREKYALHISPLTDQEKRKHPTAKFKIVDGNHRFALAALL